MARDFGPGLSQIWAANGVLLSLVFGVAVDGSELHFAPRDGTVVEAMVRWPVQEGIIIHVFQAFLGGTKLTSQPPKATLRADGVRTPRPGIWPFAAPAVWGPCDEVCLRWVAMDTRPMRQECAWGRPQTRG